MYALVDCNNFYVSCERVFNAQLWDKPVVVLSNNDGCIISRSQEAKALGIKMGEPYFQRRRWLREQGVHVFSSNYTLYGDMSGRVMKILADFTPHLEIYSIDEAFLDLSGFGVACDWVAYAHTIQQRVKQWLGLPVCVGIGPTKTLAKAANFLAKKDRRQTGGVWVLDTPRKRQEGLTNMPVQDVWGIGRQHAARLEQAGIDTAWALAQKDEGWARRQLGGVVGVRLLRELQGKVCLWQELPQRKQSIACTRSFGKPVTSLEHLQEAVATYATRAAEKLRRQQSAARAITVFAHTNRHAPVEQYFKTKIIELPVASDSTLELVQLAVKAVQSLYREDILYGKAGVILTDLVPREAVQADLFSTPAVLAHKGLMQALDTLNNLWGANTVTVAATGWHKEKRQGWQMLQQMQSNRYTTHWEELLIVGC